MVAEPQPRAGRAPSPAPASSRQTILFLAANSPSREPLALQREAKEITRKIRAATFREHFVLSPLGEATPGDFQDALLHERPSIVHFSGHGRGNGSPAAAGREVVIDGVDDLREGIVMCSEIPGEVKIVDGDALATTLVLYRQHVRMVVLNACCSLPMATTLAEVVDFAVGMDGLVADEAARLFSVGLYRGLAHGESVLAAFGMGVAEMKLGGFKLDAQRPALRWREASRSGPPSICAAGC